MLFARKPMTIPSAAEALPGRTQPIPTAERHFVNGRPLQGPYPEGTETAIFGLGCFWGAERKFWQMGEGVWITAAGYAAGVTPNPTYEEVCSGMTGHNEVVLVVVRSRRSCPTRRCSRPSGRATTRPRACARATTSARNTAPASMFERRAAQAPRKPRKRAYEQALGARATVRSRPRSSSAGPFYFAEDYHQQYLAKNPAGYCGLGGTGVACPIGTGVAA